MSINRYGRLRTLLLATTSGLAVGAVFSGTALAQTVTSRVAAQSTLENSGTITSSGSQTSAVGFEGAGTFINKAGAKVIGTNNAVGVGVTTAVAAGTVSIINEGTIEATGTPGGNDVAAVYLEQSASVTNRGTIEGKGSAHGIVVTNVAAGTSNTSGTTIENSGTIKAASGHAIALYAPIRSITNSGQIISESNSAIYIGKNGAVTESITNSGTIRGGATDGSGTAIDASASTANLVVNNSGTIIGKIRFGSGADTLNITGGSITGDVIGGVTDTVNFALGTRSFTTGGKFTGIGTLNVNSGTVTLADTVTGASAFNIAAGAKLNQRSSIAASTVTNAGTLDVGTSQQTITGNYVQTGTGTLATTITDTASGSLKVSGSANVAGQIYADTSDRAAPIVAGQSFTVLEAASLTSTATLSRSTLANFTVQNTNNQIRLVLQGGLNQNNPTVQTITRTPAASGLIKVLEKFASKELKANPQLKGVLDNLTKMAPEVVGEASIRLTPNTAISGGNSTAITNVTNTFSNNISVRLASVRPDDQQTGLAGGDGVLRGIELWTQPFISSITQDQRNGIDGFKARSRGVSVGADTLVAENIRVGLALGFGVSDVDGRGTRVGDSADIDSYQATLYASYSRGPWFADLQLGYALNKFEQQRNTGAANLNQIAKADYDADQYSARVSGGYNIAMGGLELTPNAFFQVTRTSQDGYTETGAGAAGLRVNSVDQTSTQAGIGLRLAYPVAVQGGRLVPELRIGYVREFNNDRPTVTSTFLGDTTGSGSFNSLGVSPEKNRYNAGLGVTFFSDTNLTVSGNYDMTHTSDSNGHTGFVRLRYKF